jgi:hypothetical protein
MGMKALLNKAGFSKRSGTPIYELVYVLVLWVWLKKDSILVGSGRGDEDESGRRRHWPVALSFCRLLGLGCPKQAFAKIATPRSSRFIIE